MALPIEQSKADVADVPQPVVEHLVENTEIGPQKKRKLSGESEEKSEIKSPNVPLSESEAISWGSLLTDNQGTQMPENSSERVGVVLEPMSNSAPVSLNNVLLRKGARAVVRDGDSILFVGSQPYTFQVVLQEQGLQKFGLKIAKSASNQPTSFAQKLFGPTPQRSNTPTLPRIMSESELEKLSDQLKKVSSQMDTRSMEEWPTEMKPSRDLEMKEAAKKFVSNLVQNQQAFTATFDSIESLIPETVKNSLIQSCFLYFEKPEYLKFLQTLPPTRNILLNGPEHCDLLQEKIVISLKNHFQCTFIPIDSIDLAIECDTSFCPRSCGCHKAKPKLEHDESMTIPKLHSKKFLAEPVSVSGLLSRKVEVLSRKSEEKLDCLFLSSVLTEIQDLNKPCIVLFKDSYQLFSDPDRLKTVENFIQKLPQTKPIVFIACVTEKPPKEESPLMKITFEAFKFLERKENERTEKQTKTVFGNVFSNKIMVADLGADIFQLDKKSITASINMKIIRYLAQKNNIQVLGEPSTSSRLSDALICKKTLELGISQCVAFQVFSSQMNLNEEGKLLLPIEVMDGLMKDEQVPTMKKLEKTTFIPENDYERRVADEIVLAKDINVKFEDIGGAELTKKLVKELIILPLQRPELFTRGALAQPLRGLLLFGPPGTGKSMFAKAIASQSGANFMSLSMSTIGSKYFGETEKYVKATFTAAKKMSPCVIFIDEVDSLLGRRDKEGEHEAMRKVKNEFMQLWDGLKTNENDRVLVLGATNRPFDLDEAVLRRFSRRIFLDLPDLPARKQILTSILSHETLEPNFNLEKIAEISEGFSGSDLKNTCIAAAYRPVREILEKEVSLNQKFDASNLRPLKTIDLEICCKEIGASLCKDSTVLQDLRKWNEQFGECGSRAQSLALSYYM